MNYKLIKEEIVYDGFLKMKLGTIEHDLFNSSHRQTVTRESLERGDSVAIVIYETDTDSILFTYQFRYATIGNGNGWLLEIPAGSLEKGEDPVDCAKREIDEEIGYDALELDYINTFYLSPGGSSERIILYYTEVRSDNKTKDGGGKMEENEDIQIRKIAVSELNSKISDGTLADAKSIIGIQWFLSNRKSL